VVVVSLSLSLSLSLSRSLAVVSLAYEVEVMAGILKLKAAYDAWVVEHASLLSSFENFMRYSLYLVPIAGGPRGDATVEGGTPTPPP